MEQKDKTEQHIDRSYTAIEQEVDRSYAPVKGDTHLAFDPLKDLNLPSSYDEVLSRFRHLQGERAWEVSN